MSSYAPMTGGGGRRYENADPYGNQGSQHDYGQRNNHPSQESGNGRAGYNQYQNYSPAPNPPRQPASDQSSYPHRQFEQERYASGRNEYGGDAMEMGNMGLLEEPKNVNDPMYILDMCTYADKILDQVPDRVGDLRKAQTAALGDPNARGASGQDMQVRADEIVKLFDQVKDSLVKVKKKPAAHDPKDRYKKHVDRVHNRMSEERDKYLQAESNYRAELGQQIERQMLVADPNARREDIEAAKAHPERIQVYADSLKYSTRSGQARSALRAVQERHDAILKIEKDFALILSLINEVGATVAEQEPQFEAVEHYAAQAEENVGRGKEHLVEGEKKARAARKKKFICLGITILIILIIAAVIAIAVVVTQK